MMRILTTIGLFGLAVILHGCATNVSGPNSDALKVAQSVPTELIAVEDEALQQQTSYLGRYLLDDEYRISVSRTAIESDWGKTALVDLVEYGNIGDSTVLGMAASQAITGNALSADGTDTAFYASLGVDLLNTMLATQRKYDVSTFFMPNVFNGVKVESADHAICSIEAFAVLMLASVLCEVE